MNNNVELIKCPECGKYLDIETNMCAFCGYEERGGNGKSRTDKEDRKRKPSKPIR